MIDPPAYTPTEQLQALRPSLDQMLRELRDLLARAEQRAQHAADLLDLLTDDAA